MSRHAGVRLGAEVDPAGFERFGAAVYAMLTPWQRLQSLVRENARGLHAHLRRSDGIDARRALSTLAAIDAQRAVDDVLDEVYEFERTAPAMKDGRPHPRVAYLMAWAGSIRPALTDGAGEGTRV
jgi:hypothetical protein